MKPLLRVGIPLWSLLISSALLKVRPTPSHTPIRNPHFTFNLYGRYLNGLKFIHAKKRQDYK